MAEILTIVAALLIQQEPICVACMAEKATASSVEIESALASIGRAIMIERVNARCSVCDQPGAVCFIEKTLPA